MRSKKRHRPVPSDLKERQSQITAKGKKRALALLDRCLNSCCLEDRDHSSLMQEVAVALDVNDDFITILETPATEKVKRQSYRSSKPKISAGKNDPHNEVCEVCDAGGDLLCCDTCSLTFHVGCLRPKISSIPKGKWSCAHCILDGLSAGDTATSKKAIQQMNRLCKGLSSDDEGDGSGITRLGRSRGDISVIRTGRRFVVRKAERGQFTEMGRYYTLEAALGLLAPSSVSSSPRRLAGERSRRSQGSDSDSSDEDKQVGCTHCLDDGSVLFCAFCGCQTCFGKENSDFLLVCDGCDSEYHTYCLSPQITEIPESSWYCALCESQGMQEDTSADENQSEVSTNKATLLSSIAPESEVPDKHKKRSATAEDSKMESKAAIVSSPKPVIPVNVRDNTVESKYTSEILANLEERRISMGPSCGRGRGRPPSLYRLMAIASSMQVAGNEDLAQASGSSRLTVEAPSAPVTSPTSCTGIDGAHSAIAKAGECAFTATEKNLLAQFRMWAPAQDLDVAAALLHIQRAHLLKRVLVLDPTYQIVKPNHAFDAQAQHGGI